MRNERRLAVALALAALAAWGTPAAFRPASAPALAEDDPMGGDKKPGEEGKPKDGDPPKEGEKPKDGEKPPAPAEDEVKEFCKDYESKISKMLDEDAMQGLDRIHAWYQHPELPDAARKAILGAVGKVVKLRGREAVTEKVAKVLADFGETGVTYLKYIVDSSLKQKAPPSGVLSAAFKSLGKIASPKAGDVKFLTDQLKCPEDDVISKAAQALAGYGGAPGAVRRDIFEELLKISEGVYSGAQNNEADKKRKWNIWGEDVIDAMQKLTKQNWTKPPEFRAWLNNKDAGGGKNPKTWADPEPSGG